MEVVSYTGSSAAILGQNNSQTAANGASYSGLGAASAAQSSDQLVLSGLSTDDSATFNSESGISDSLILEAKNIYEKIQELLKEKQGNYDLLPADESLTPQKSADWVVAGIAKLFDAYSKSNPDLSPEEQISHFIASAREGVQKGYDEAFSKLQDIGAFKIDGVQGAVEQTKILVEKGLDSLEKFLRDKFVTQTTTESKATNDTVNATA